MRLKKGSQKIKEESLEQRFQRLYGLDPRIAYAQFEQFVKWFQEQAVSLKSNEKLSKIKYDDEPKKKFNPSFK